MNSNNKLGVKGVCFYDTRKKRKYRAQLWRDGKFVLNKYFATLEEASDAYKAACLKYIVES